MDDEEDKGEAFSLDDEATVERVGAFERPTAGEQATLRRVSGPVPYQSFLIAVVVRVPCPLDATN